MPARSLKTTATAAALAIGLLTVVPTSAVFAAPTPSPSASSADGDPQVEERAPLTPEQVHKQVAEAARLRAALAKDDAALAKASQRLAALSATSNSLMSQVTDARTAEAAAQKAEAVEVARLKKLTGEVAAARRDLESLAYDAYVKGPGLLREVAAVLDLVSAGGERADAAGRAQFLADARSSDQEKFTRLAARQRETAARAAAARSKREAATAKAEKAQKAAAAAVAEQQQAVVALQKATADRRAELEKLGVDASLVAGVDLDSLANLSTTPLCTEEKSDYPNGQWPGTALCPLADAPGHMLRPSAARAYNALSAAYRKAHGTNLCLTDSYRSLAAQIDVKRRKPTLAATPGTSNHGLGKAVDLCGGIESFGTPQHIWMQQHAPLYGFFHPAWAEPNGSKPEPWHWEFAG